VSDDPRVQELLDELLDSGSTPEEVCATCPELLPEVQTRWRQIRRLRAGLDALFPPSGETPLRPAEEIPAPPQIPGYVIEGVLGRGGMGIVYRARHLRLNRLVALKMSLAGSTRERRESERFKREAEAVAGLRHPNIAQLYDAGEVDGHPYFTMEIVEGGSLAKKIAGTPQPARAAAQLVATLSGAVQAAHACAIVHRDLKPGNVLLAADGTPKISDFGLARRLDDGAGLTQSGVAVGTPSYMAPEQAEGRPDATGPAVDIYALGAILYELLTGRPPFQGENAAATMYLVTTRDPVPPSRLNPNAPRDLETICLKCLHKLPARRYSTAQELADDLGRFLEGKPVRARPVGVVERALKWARRHPTAALLTAVLLFALVAGIGTVVWVRQQEDDRRAAKDRQEGQARAAVETALNRANDLKREERWSEAVQVLADAEPHLTEANSPPLEEKLRKAQSDYRAAAELQSARESLPLLNDGTIDYKQRAEKYLKAFEYTGFSLEDDPETVAARIRDSAIREQLVAALDDRAVVAFMLGDKPLTERFLPLARLADPGSAWRDQFRDPDNWRKGEHLRELAATVFTSSPPPTEHQLALLGLLLKSKGEWGQCARLLGEACRRQPRNFWAHREMASVLILQNQNLEAAGYYRVALSIRPDSTSAHEGLAGCLARIGRTDESIAAYRRAMELAAPNNSAIRTRLVLTLTNAGYWTDAAAECLGALRASPTNYVALHHLANALHRQDRIEEALVLARKAVEIAPDADETHALLGSLCAQAGRHEEAAKAFRRTMELNSRYYRANLFAHELAAVAQWEEAIAVLRAAIAREPTNPWLPFELGQIYRSRGKPEEAAKALRTAADRSPGVAPPHEALAAVQLALGRFAEARTAVESLLKMPAHDALRRAWKRQLDLCDALLAVETKLPAILAGKEPVTDAPTQRAVAEWCLNYKRLPVTAAGFYASALATQPALADDAEPGNRFHAARAAALAGCGIGEDATRLSDQRRAELRKAALDWLTAETDARAEQHRAGKPGERTVVATAVRSWLVNEDLACVREEALTKLPAEERRAWQALWERAAALARRDPVALLARARAHIARTEWEKAAACFAERMELEPTDDADLWFEFAATQLLAGDQPGYRDSRAHMLARCQPKGPMRAYLVARAWTLAPAALVDLMQPTVLSKNELLDHDHAEFWALTELGAVRFRNEQLREAVAVLEKSLVADSRPGRAVLNWLWLALAHHRMGSPAEARRWLAKATNWLDQQGGRMPLEQPLMGSHRHNWLEAHVLRREVEALLPK
jgi:serine/threonine-protein kinase